MSPFVGRGTRRRPDARPSAGSRDEPHTRAASCQRVTRSGDGLDRRVGSRVPPHDLAAGAYRRPVRPERRDDGEPMTARVRRAVLLLVALLVAGVALVVVGGALGPAPADGRDGPVEVDPQAAPGDAVAALRARLERRPDDAAGWAALGTALVDRARSDADPALYAQAEQALDESSRLQPEDNAPALVGQGALAAARHDFRAAEALARDAVEVNPYGVGGHVVLVDALVEQGRYDEAVEALDVAGGVDPGLAVLTRVSYLRELYGDVDGARVALADARRSAVRPVDVAYVDRLLAELAWHVGDLDGAAAAYDAGLRLQPDDAVLLAGQAEVAAARGDVDAALAGYAAAAERSPLPSVARLAFGATATGGVDTDRDTAVFDADHGRPEQALASARGAAAREGGVFVDDALGWSLHANGDDAAALAHLVDATRLGTPRASFWYHRGVVEAALGRDAEAAASLETALGLNPAFSPVHAPRARALLAELRA